VAHARAGAESVRNATTAQRAREIFTHHAETFVRQSAALGYAATGYVFIWDNFIARHRREALNATGGHRADVHFQTLVDVLAHYASGGAYASSFALNVYGVIQSAGLFSNHSDFLADGHHPNDAGYRVVADIVAHSLLGAWIHGLSSGAFLPRLVVANRGVDATAQR